MNKLVVFVCRGNIGRSPFAEAILKQELVRKSMASTVSVVSRGVQGTAVDPEPVKFPNMTYYKEMFEDSKPTLQKFGVDMSRHVSTPISAEDVANATVVIAMDSKTREALKALFPDKERKVHLLTSLVGGSKDITDPEHVSGKEKQEQIFSEIHDIIHAGLPRLIALLGED